MHVDVSTRINKLNGHLKGHLQVVLTYHILDNCEDGVTFWIAAWNTINVTALFSGVTGIIDTFQSVVSCTPTELGATIAKNDLTRLAQKDRIRAECLLCMSLQHFYLLLCMMEHIYHLIIVIVIIQTATLLNGHTARPIKHKPRFAETTTNTRAIAIGGRFPTSGYASWTTVYVFCIRRTWFCAIKNKIRNEFGKIQVNTDTDEK